MEIKKKANHYEFPIASLNPRVEEVAEMTKSDVGYHKGHF